MPNAPALIFTRGPITPADHRRGVAIIGTRHPSPTGVWLANAVASGLTQAGYSVISGLARGIDAAAHTAALAAGGRTVAVLGTGLAHAYPPEHAALQGRMHLLVSQFWPEDGPRREAFPARNLTMSAFARATVIIEAGERSGARIQARHAIEQGRPLYLMRPVLDQPWANELLERPGVHALETSDDLIDVLGR